MTDRRFTPLMIAALFAAGAAHAQTNSVANQVDDYLKTSPAAALPSDTAPGVTTAREARQVHGEVGVAMGTGGYRSAYVRSEMPIGKTATLTVAVAESRFNGRFGRRGSNRFGLGMAFGDAAGPSPLR